MHPASRLELVPENPAAAPVRDDPWQFSNFVFRP
jgi:hypothetical protein